MWRSVATDSKEVFMRVIKKQSLAAGELVHDYLCGS